MVFQIICRKTLMATSAIHSVSCLQVKATNLSEQPIRVVDLGVLLGEQLVSLLDDTLPWARFVEHEPARPGLVGPHGTLSFRVPFETLAKLRDLYHAPHPQLLHAFLREQSGELHRSEPYLER